MRMPNVERHSCANGEAVVVRFFGERISPVRYGEEFPGHFADAVMDAADIDETRFVVLDIRNFTHFSGDLFGKCILVFKRLRQKRRELVVLCEPDVAELFELIKLDRLLSVVQTEARLQELVESAADLPYIVNGAAVAS